MGHFGQRNMDKLDIVEKTNINSMPSKLGGLFAVHKYKSKIKQGKVFAKKQAAWIDIVQVVQTVRKTVLSTTHKVKKKITVALSIMSLFK